VNSIHWLVMQRSIMPAPGNLVSALQQSRAEPHIMYMSKPPTWVWRYTERMISCKQSYTPGSHDLASFVMQSEPMIMQTWWLWLSNIGDTLPGWEHVNSEFHFGASIKWTWWRTLCCCIWGWLIRWRLIWRWSIWRMLNWRCSIGREAQQHLTLYSFMTSNCGNVESWAQHSVQCDKRWDMRDERLALGGRVVILCWSSTPCMQYSVNENAAYAVLNLCITSSMQYSVSAVLSLCSTRSMQYPVYAVLHLSNTQSMQDLVHAICNVCDARW